MAGVRPSRPPLWRQYPRSGTAVGALAIVLTIIVLALAAPILPLQDPIKPSFGQRLLPPLQAGHVFGTDQLGRDLLSRLIWGARVRSPSERSRRSSRARSVHWSDCWLGFWAEPSTRC
jgi:ABC-type dipeptide/oligopeptide/nickel transport system permease subunit